jgi:hypothetical protein
MRSRVCTGGGKEEEEEEDGLFDSESFFSFEPDFVKAGQFFSYSSFLLLFLFSGPF